MGEAELQELHLLAGEGEGEGLDEDGEQDDGEAVGVGHVQRVQPTVQRLCACAMAGTKQLSNTKTASRVRLVSTEQKTVMA